MARDFNGTSDRIALANEGNFDFERTQAFSIAAWLWVNTPVATGRAVFAKQGNTGNQTGYRVILGGDDLCNMTLRNAGAAQILKRDDTAFPDSTWVHRVWTYSGNSLASGINFYTNAVLSASVTTVVDTLGTNTILNNITPQIGSKDAGLEFFVGRIAGVVVDNTEWSAADVNRLYWTGMPPRGFSGTKSFHPIWSDDLLDKGASGGNGTATGTTMIASPPRVGRAPALLFV